MVNFIYFVSAVITGLIGLVAMVTGQFFVGLFALGIAVWVGSKAKDGTLFDE